MNKYKCFAFLLFAALSGCSMPLYYAGPSSTDIESAQYPDISVPDIHKMYLLVDVGLIGPMSFGTLYLTGKDFSDEIIHEADICHVQALSSFDERLKIIQPALYTLSDEGRNDILKTDHSKIVDFNPDVVLFIKLVSHTMTTQLARTTLSNFAYTVSLQNYPSGQDFWRATVNLQPGQSQDSGSPSVVLARDLLKRMAEDGMLKDCPPQQTSQP